MHALDSLRRGGAQNIDAWLCMQVPSCEPCLPLFHWANGVRRINVQGVQERTLWGGPHSNATSFSEREGTRDPGHPPPAAPRSRAVQCGRAQNMVDGQRHFPREAEWEVCTILPATWLHTLFKNAVPPRIFQHHSIPRKEKRAARSHGSGFKTLKNAARPNALCTSPHVQKSELCGVQPQL